MAVLPPTRLMLKAVQDLLHPLLGDEEAVYTVTKAQCNGTWYSQGCAVVVGISPEGFTEFAIVYLCCLLGGELFLVCNRAFTTRYIHHLHAYGLTMTDKYVFF